MWKTILNNDEVLCFMESMCYFHDSCIKEIKYISGAYVNEDLSIYPINQRRSLKVIVQRQYESNSMIEMEFLGLKSLKLLPVDESCTCEILDSTMYIRNGVFYWCDKRCAMETDLDICSGILISALGFRWRSIENHMGGKEFYIAQGTVLREP